MSGDPFAAPSRGGADPMARAGTALLPWALFGAVSGTAVGFTLHMTRTAEGLAATLGGAGTVAAVGLGWAAFQFDRSRVADLPLPRRGQAWPVHGAVVGLPLAGLIPACTWLGVVAAASARSLIPVGIAGAAVVGVAVALVRVWSDHRLVVGLQALAQDEPDIARLALTTLAQHPLATRRARRSARLNLGGLLLSDGELSAAAHWFAQVPDAALACAGLAVARVGLGQVEAAAAALEAGQQCEDASRARPELDAARVLLLWRTEGSRAARELAERLDGPASGGLFRQLRASLAGEAVEGGPLLDKLRAAVAG